MATHAVRKAAHALAEEGELLNVYAELKDVANAFDNRLKLQERATKTLLTWAQRKREDAAIVSFLESIAEVETDMLGTDRRYNDAFRVFVKIWKNVLAEKKELNSKVSAYKKAQKNVDQAKKKLAAADTRQPRDEEKVMKAKKQLQSMEEAAEEVRQAMETKLLEVQQDKHACLRSGYADIFKAGFVRLRELVDLHRKLREVINGFPSVKGRNPEDGTFVFEAFIDSVEDVPLWCKGEERDKELRELKSRYEAELEAIRTKHSQELSRVIQEREANDLSKDESYSAEIVNLVSANKKAMQDLQNQHQADMDRAKAQRQKLIDEHEQAVSGLKQKIAQLERHLDERRREIVRHVKENTRLEEQLEGAVHMLPHAASTAAQDLIVAAGTLIERPAASLLFESIRQCRQAFDELASLASVNCDAEEYAQKVSAYGAACNTAAAAAWAMARCSRAENSSDLLQAAQSFVAIAKQAVFMKVWPKAASSGSSTTYKESSSVSAETSSASQSQKTAKDKTTQMCVALYDHKAKVQQGFTLLGFTKGEELVLVRQRADGWSKVKRGEESGWAPTSYLQVVAPEEKEDEIAENKAEDASDVSDGVSGVHVPQVYPVDTARAEFEKAIRHLHDVGKDVEARDRKLALLDNALVDNIGSKVSAAQQSVLDTLGRIAKLRSESAEHDKGRRLEVNTALLDLGEKLLKLMQSIMGAADNMRGALESTKGMQSDEEFNSKHASWFGGLTAAVDAMVEGNPVLMEALRSVVRQQGKHEELQVATRNISAAVARLAAMTRTKNMPRDDTSQGELNHLTEEFRHASHDMLSAARECQELDLASVVLQDLGNLSENDAKRLMMATQVHVLKLQKELENEHEKLRRLRRMVNVDDDKE